MTNRSPKIRGVPPEHWQDLFITALEEYGNIHYAAAKANVSRQTAYRHKNDDPDFAERWNAALAMGTESLEDEARRRAYEGVKKPIYQNGKRVGYVQEYSDTLLIFLLKAHKPTIYRETVRTELTGKNGGPVEIVDVVTPEELAAYATAAAALNRAQDQATDPSRTDDDLAEGLPE